MRTAAAWADSKSAGVMCRTVASWCRGVAREGMRWVFVQDTAMINKFNTQCCNKSTVYFATKADT